MGWNMMSVQILSKLSKSAKYEFNSRNDFNSFLEFSAGCCVNSVTTQIYGIWSCRNFGTNTSEDRKSFYVFMTSHNFTSFFLSFSLLLLLLPCWQSVGLDTWYDLLLKTAPSWVRLRLWFLLGFELVFHPNCQSFILQGNKRLIFSDESRSPSAFQIWL